MEDKNTKASGSRISRVQRYLFLVCAAVGISIFLYWHPTGTDPSEPIPVQSDQIDPSPKALKPKFPNPSDIPVHSRIITPRTNVGPILRTSSEVQLVTIFGKESVKHIDVSVGEGETVPGTVIFQGTSNEVTIEWKNDRKNPARITISQKGTDWRTEEGITVGTSIEEVERINGAPFSITGFEWDYPGRSVAWRGGKLPQQLQIDFGPTNTVPQEDYLKVIGNADFSSSNEVFSRMKLVVDAIYIRWD